MTLKFEEGKVWVRDLTKSNLWDTVTIKCAYNDKSEYKSYEKWKLNTIRVGMVLSITGKAAYKVEET